MSDALGGNQRSKRRLHAIEGLARSKDGDDRQRHYRPNNQHENPVQHRETMTRVYAQSAAKPV